MLFATILTLVLIPCLLAVLNDLRRLGHLALTIGAGTYQAISTGGVAFLPPHNPGLSPFIAGGQTAAQIADVRRAHALKLT